MTTATALALIDAAKHGRLSELKELIASGVDVNLVADEVCVCVRVVCVFVCSSCHIMCVV